MRARINRREFMKMAGLTGAGLALASCAPKATPTAAPAAAPTTAPAGAAFTKNKLTVAISWGPHELEVANRVFAEKFAKKTGLDVTLEYVPGDQYDAKVYTNLISDNPYDVLSVGSGWLPAALSKDVLVPLNDLIAKEKFDTANIVQSALDEWIYDGQIYGLPADLFGMHAFFNVDLFEKAGLKVPAPTDEWTWDQLLDLAKKLTIKEGDQVVQYGLASPTDWIWDIWPNMNGAFLFEDGMTDAKLTDPAVIEAFEFYRSMLHDEGVAIKNGAIEGSVEDLFMAGGAAIMFNGTWATGYLRAKKADMKYKWDVSILPKGPNAAKALTPSNTGGWVIPKVAQDVAASWEAVKFQAGDEFAQDVMFRALSGLPCTKSALAGAWYAQWPENPPEGQTKEFFGKMLDMLAPLQYTRFDLGTEVMAAMSKLDMVYSNEQKPADLFPTMQEEVSAALKARPWNQG